MVLVPDFDGDMTKKGWVLVKDVDPILPGLGSDVEYVSFLREGEKFFSGDELSECALVLDVNYGQRDAEWLYGHQEKLPERPEEVFFIFFPGTVWKHPNGTFLIPYLFWTGESWDIYFFWLSFGFSEGSRLVRPR